MSTLLVQELKTELSHVFKMNLNTRSHVGAFLPLIYIHNVPAGLFKFEVVKDAAVIFEQEFTSLDVQGALNDYLYVFYPAIPLTPLQLENGTYTAKLSAVSGYSYSDNAFIGWIQQHENIQNEMDYVPVDDTENPLAMRIKIYKQGCLN